MQPLFLSLQGIYSYQEKQIIDFSKLTKSGLFGIFGQTGSGKSTILEAIIYALYGESARLNKQDNRIYNMMNLRSDELIIDFIFEHAEKKYRFIARAKRNSKNYENIPKVDRKGYVNENNEWIPLESNDAGEILGISCENFNRTVIIPQGQFMDFINLGAADRVKMIKDLFGLEKYELYNKTSSIDKKNEEQINLLRGKLEQIGEINEEQLNSKKDYLETLHKLCTDSDKELQILKIRKDALESLKDKDSKLKKFKLEHAALLDKKIDIAIKEKDIIEYEECTSKFKESLSRKNEYQQQIVYLTNSLELSKNQKMLLEKEIQEKAAVVSQLNADIEKHQGLELELNDLNTMVQLVSVIEKIRKESLRIPEADKAIADVKEKIKNTENLISESNQKLVSLKQGIEKLIELSLLKGKFVELNLILGEIEKQKTEILQTEKIIKEKSIRIKSLLVSFGFSEVKGYEDTIAAIEKSIIGLKKKISDLQQHLNNSKVQAELSVIAEKLEDGKPCPVCGALEHPSIRHKQDVDSEILLLTEQIQKEEDLLNKLQHFLPDYKVQWNEIQNMNNVVEQISGLMHKNVISRNILQSELENKKEDDISRLHQNAENDQKLIKNIESEVAKLTEMLEQLKKKELFYSEQLQKIKDEILQLDSVSKTLQGQLNTLKIDDFINKPEGEIRQNANNLRLFMNKQKQELLELQSVLQQINMQFSQMVGTINSGQESLIQYQNKLNLVAKELETAIFNSEYKTEETVINILKRNINITQLRKEVEEFHKELAIVQSNISELIIEIGEKSFNDEEYSKVVEDFNEKSELYEKQKEELIKTKEQILQTEKSLSDYKFFYTELEKHTFKKQNIQILKNMFKASGFVNYVSTVYLQNLCSLANERFFRLTKQSLSMEIGEDNSFVIRDYLNNGKIRSIKTLSGGQSFQAALSLALALSESVQMTGTEKHKFFFIDEGFGSQDKDSLRIVFETLKSLIKEGKIVGIISHVEDLKDEISTYVTVCNDSEIGSRIVL